VSEADAPTSWQDLLDPAWQDNIGLQTPTGGGAFSWYVWMRDAVFGGDEDAWRAYMEDLAAQNPVMLPGLTEINQLLASGEVAVLAAALPDYIQALKDDGAPVEWVATPEVSTTGITLSLAADAPHPNAGMLFLAWILSEEGQEIVAQDVGAYPVLESAVTDTFERLTTAELTPKPIDDLDANREEYLEQVREIFQIP
jgi:iron(III) transport system substrate-binding protein